MMFRDTSEWSAYRARLTGTHMNILDAVATFRRVLHDYLPRLNGTMDLEAQLKLAHDIGMDAANTVNELINEHYRCPPAPSAKESPDKVDTSVSATSEAAN